MDNMKALIFDCDGVIAETERDGHRVSFNRVFKEMGINAVWSVEEYEELLKTAGGKERMKAYFDRHPEVLSGKVLSDGLIKTLHARKTEIFMKMSKNGELQARPGIKRLINEAHEKGLLLAVCSTSNEKSVKTLIKSAVGEKEFLYFNGIFAGDMVKEKKPAPDIYNMVTDTFNLKAAECFVIEDNQNGMMAAKNAGMYCMVTVSFYSRYEDLKEADLVVSSLGDPGTPITVMGGSPMINQDIGYITVDVLESIVSEGGI